MLWREKQVTNIGLAAPARKGSSVHPLNATKSESNLLPVLGVFTTTLLVIGSVIGSGIFRKPGVMAGQLGSPGVLLGVWVLAGIITMFGALSNAEISGLIPETGGQYVFFRKMYGDFFAYLYGWAIFAVVQTGSIAALAYVFAEYTTQFVSLPEASTAVAAWSFHLPFVGDVMPFRELGVKVLAGVVIIVLTAINYVGVRFGGIVHNIFTIAKVTGMAALFIAAFLPISGGHAANLTTSSSVIHKEGLALVVAIAAALQGAFWAYDGWVKVTYIAGEVRNSQHVIVTAIYVLMNVAYCWVLPIDVMAQSKLVAADVAEHVFNGGGKWVAVIVMISTFGANNGVILTSARVYFAMAQRNVFPALIGRVHPRFHTPAASLIAQGAWGIVLVFSGTFDMITDTLIFVAWIFYAAGAFGVFVLRRKMPDAPRPYRVPGYPFVPAMFVLFATAFLILTVCNDVTAYRASVAVGKPALINSAFGTMLVLLGVPIFLWYRRSRRLPSA
jgi:APA family basic amino acid/polyamine antiporter